MFNFMIQFYGYKRKIDNIMNARTPAVSVVFAAVAVRLFGVDLQVAAAEAVVAVPVVVAVVAAAVLVAVAVVA